LLGKRGSESRKPDAEREPPRDRKQRRRAAAVSARPRTPK
jgi:hypothetical protein